MLCKLILFNCIVEKVNLFEFWIQSYAFYLPIFLNNTFYLPNFLRVRIVFFSAAEIQSGFVIFFNVFHQIIKFNNSQMFKGRIINSVDLGSGQKMNSCQQVNHLHKKTSKGKNIFWQLIYKALNKLLFILICIIWCKFLCLYFRIFKFCLFILLYLCFLIYNLKEYYLGIFQTYIFVLVFVKFYVFVK